MALPQQIARFVATAEPIAQPDAAVRVRRCTFRRLSRVPGNGKSAYSASCLFPDRRLPLPLGDVESSQAICESCRADHIFRPDED